MATDLELARAQANVELLRQAVCSLLDANVKLLAALALQQGETLEDLTTPPSIGAIRSDLLDARDALFRYNARERAEHAAGSTLVS